jgi:hypothetical protein
MGLLSLGTPLAWNDAKKYADHVREHGITQFLHIWDKVKDRCGDELLWGDEVCLPCPIHPRYSDRPNACISYIQIEYMVVAFDNAERNAKLSLRQSEILAKLQQIVDDIACGCDRYVRLCLATPHITLIPVLHPASLFRLIIQSMDVLCWSQHQVHRTQGAWVISCVWNQTCEIGMWGYSDHRSVLMPFV